MTRIVETFRPLQSGKHIGKFVLEAGPGVLVRATEPEPQGPTFRADGCYLVSGGLGGLGRQIYKWLVECGARHVVTLSRQVPQDTTDFMEGLRALGGELLPLQCNIGNEHEVREAICICGKAFGVVHSVFQASMALDNTTFENMTAQALRNALVPKVAGTINLANALQGQKLDFFVMLSSLVGVIGNKAQANYAAGSTFQDRFAETMIKAGIPALSLDLGAIESAGYVSQRPEVMQSLKRKGLVPVKLDTLLALLLHSPTRLKGEDTVPQLLIGLPEFAQQADHKDWAFQDAKFASLASVHDTKANERSGGVMTNVHDALDGVKDQAGAELLFCERVIQRTAALLNIEASEIQPEANMAKLGVDSLVAVELRNWINQECSCQISVLQLLNAKSMVALSASIFASSSLTRDLRRAGSEDAQAAVILPAEAERNRVKQDIVTQP